MLQCGFSLTGLFPYSGILNAVIDEVYVLINLIRSVSGEIVPHMLIVVKMMREI